MKRILVDANGGDKAPKEVLLGAALAASNADLKIVMVGKTAALKSLCAELSVDAEQFDWVEADDIITMEDEPTIAVRRKKDSSLVVGMHALAEGEADAFVSAGSTGAVLTAATLIAGRIGGVKRPALAPVMPTLNGYTMLLDCGANAECKSEYLLQFAKMGSAYMCKMFGKDNPSVKLLNIGAEEHKGTEMHKEAYLLLQKSNLNFQGNMEPNEWMFGNCDVLVSDGFSGNVLLKSSEGVAKALLSKLKTIYMSGTLAKLSAAMVKGKLSDLRKSMDASEVGGVPLLGIAKPVVKAHGNSDANAIYHAIMQAFQYADSGIIEELKDTFSK